MELINQTIQKYIIQSYHSQVNVSLVAIPEFRRGAPGAICESIQASPRRSAVTYRWARLTMFWRTWLAEKAPVSKISHQARLDNSEPCGIIDMCNDKMSIDKVSIRSSL